MVEKPEEIFYSQGGPEEPWKGHSRLVAETASQMGQALKDRGYPLNLEYLYGAALLHDVGRSIDQGERHGIEGWKLLKKKGYSHYGRFCLTHYFKGRSLEEAMQDGTFEREELRKIFEEVQPDCLTLEDKIIILADGMCAGEKRVSLKERIQDWEKRYGESPWITKTAIILKKLQEEFTRYLGRNPEEIFFPPKLSHLSSEGAALMVDISQKTPTIRMATAVGSVKMAKETLRVARESKGPKGEVFQVARVAGILAAKKTSDLIPLCHPLPLTSVEIDFQFPQENTIEILSKVQTTYSTGVEMEALTATSVAALTIYDMLKGIDKRISIEDIHLLEKKGGKSGDFHW